MNRWYVVRTHPHRERQAVSHLERQRFQTFLPSFRKRRSHAGRKDYVMTPLFPGYVFVEMNLEVDRWRSINGTVGVHHLICHGDRPAAVPKGIVEDLRAQTDPGDVVAPAALIVFERGDSVRVVDGALAGQTGRYDRMTANERVVLLLNVLGREIEASLPMAAVDAA